MVPYFASAESEEAWLPALLFASRTSLLGLGFISPATRSRGCAGGLSSTGPALGEAVGERGWLLALPFVSPKS